MHNTADFFLRGMFKMARFALLYWFSFVVGVGAGRGADVPGSAHPEPSWMTRKNARVYSLLTPAPRGQIVDRQGRPFAQSKAVEGLYLRLPSQRDLDPQSLARWSKEEILKEGRVISLDRIDFERMSLHQKNRPMIPFLIEENASSSQGPVDSLESNKSFLVLHRYGRSYPEGETAAHIIGYTGRIIPGGSRPLENNDLILPEEEGRDGLELVFDEFLRGERGKISLLLDEDGNITGKTIDRKPKAGLTLVTTIDLDTQKLCEKLLRESGRKGAIVVLDVENGEIVAMASSPSFDLNLFVPFVSQEDYEALSNDENAPLFARAFKGAYPPGSVFKTFVGLAAMESGIVDRDTKFNCPSSLKIGNIFFRNHGGDMGEMDVKEALAQSCNTWFYQAGIRLGADSILHWARAFGFGRGTGILLPHEEDGTIPTHEHMERTHGRAISRGDVANMSIGQGDILVTPLQMAQAMSIVANGGIYLQPRIVLQIQEIDNSVISAYPKRVLGQISIGEGSLSTLIQGLVKVTTSGTGTAAKGGKFKVAGKTGTAEWGSGSRKKNVAWFSGFAPAEEPKYAFAVALEGKTGEKVSGGKTAAPLAGRLLREILKNYTHVAKDKKDETDANVGGSTSDAENQQTISPEVVEAGVLEEVVDYSDLLDKFVDEIEQQGAETEEEPQSPSRSTGEAEDIEEVVISQSEEAGGALDRSSSNRTYDYVPEGIGTILE